jgi:hypothetical protein
VSATQSAACVSSRRSLICLCYLRPAEAEAVRPLKKPSPSPTDASSSRVSLQPPTRQSTRKPGNKGKSLKPPRSEGHYATLDDDASRDAV